MAEILSSESVNPQQIQLHILYSSRSMKVLNVLNIKGKVQGRVTKTQKRKKSLTSAHMHFVSTSGD